jgi:asparagine synthase (glutamine-hydrolysing)
VEVECASKLDGFFSFVLHDIRDGRDRIIAARDPIGVTTLYQGWVSSSPNTVFFASEVKCLQDVCDKVISFSPGHIYDSETGKTTRWYNPPWWDGTKTPHTPLDLKLLRETLERAVQKRLMSEVPYGVLLSGGLDSSLIAAIAARETEQVLEAQKARGLDVSDIFMGLAHGEGAGIGPDDEDDSSGLAAWPRLHSFSVGLPGSPDLLAACEVAKFLGTVHHEHTFTLEEGLDALQDVIYHLETYDVTTIRASTPMYLLSRKIKAQGVKMVLSGEGSDEIFAGATPCAYLAYNRLSLFPRRSIPGRPPQRMRGQSQKLELCGLSESKQVYHGLGS